MARRRSSRARRVYHRFRRGAHHVSTKTKLVNTLSLAIGLSPVIETGVAVLQQGNVKDFIPTLVDGYSAGMSSGHFSAQKAIQFYGPVVAAIVFKKILGKLKTGKLII